MARLTFKGTPLAYRLKHGSELSPSGCLEWRRSKNNRGYGVLYYDGKLRLAHRLAWLLAHGRDPLQGLVIDHICDNKACINPEHLRETTNRHNVLRSPNSPMNVSIRATDCRNGHPYGSDTPRSKQGWRICLTCKAIREGGESHSLVQS